MTIGGHGNNREQPGRRAGQEVTTGDGNDSFLTYTSGTIHSNGGNDIFDVTAHFDSPKPLVVFAGDGNDRVDIQLTSTYDFRVTAHGGNGDDYLWGSSGPQAF